MNLNIPPKIPRDKQTSINLPAVTLTWIDDKGKVKIDERPVHTFTLTNDIAYIEPKARV